MDANGDVFAFKAEYPDDELEEAPEGFIPFEGGSVARCCWGERWQGANLCLLELLAFGETRSTRSVVFWRTETRRVFWDYCCLHNSPLSSYSVLGESNECEKGTQRRRGRGGRRACVVTCMVVSMITLPLVVA